MKDSKDMWGKIAGYCINDVVTTTDLILFRIEYLALITEWNDLEHTRDKCYELWPKNIWNGLQYWLSKDDCALANWTRPEKTKDVDQLMGKAISLLYNHDLPRPYHEYLVGAIERLYAIRCTIGDLNEMIHDVAGWSLNKLIL